MPLEFRHPRAAAADAAASSPSTGSQPAAGAPAAGDGALPPLGDAQGERLGLSQPTVRLVAVLFLFIIVLLGAMVAGFRQTDVAGTTQSPTYEAALEYDRQVGEEGDVLAFQLDPLLAYTGAEALKVETHPGSETFIQEATLRLPLGPAFVSDAYAGRWRARGLEVRRFPAGDEAFQVMAVHKARRTVINASFGRDQEKPTRTRAQIILHRTPSAEERRAYEYPADLPGPPRGSQVIGHGGGSGASHRGRTWMVMSPLPVDALLDHYLFALRDARWSVISGGTARLPSGGRVHRFTLTRGAAGYTLQISPLPNPQRFTSTAMLVAF